MLRLAKWYIKDLERRCKQANFAPFDPRIGLTKGKKGRFVWDDFTAKIAEEWLENLKKKEEEKNAPVRYPEIGKKYLHYKGGIYEVITLAKHSETDEVLVIYKSIHFGSVHARPLSMWFDIIKNKNGLPIYRFELYEK